MPGDPRFKMVETCWQIALSLLYSMAFQFRGETTPICLPSFLLVLTHLSESLPLLCRRAGNLIAPCSLRGLASRLQAFQYRNVLSLQRVQLRLSNVSMVASRASNRSLREGASTLEVTRCISRPAGRPRMHLGCPHGLPSTGLADVLLALSQGQSSREHFACRSLSSHAVYLLGHFVLWR